MNAKELCTRLRASGPPLFECSPAPRDGIRVRTPFMYPDGGMIDVFVLQRGNRVEVTDFGEALGWLRMQSARGRFSPKQRRLIGDVCLTLGVELFKGQLVRRADEVELSDAVLRVAQAALRVADLWFTMRTRSVESTADEVADWLDERRIKFQRSVRYSGRSGRNWTVDFQTHVPDGTALIFVLATGSRAAARRITEHVVAGLFDLNHLQATQPGLAFVSLFDDTEDVWEEEDFRLVQDLSTIARWSRPDEFEAILRAA
ncbi:MAG: DUF1828 domain-containing protein [Deltaproteobacteria bacterium]|nr:MAG: DUF1828 domain-containing protein [Deltaproteobacteria bacterium]